MELTEFLLARIAEDEDAARDAALTVGWDGYGEQRIRSGRDWVPSYHIVKRKRDEGPTDSRIVAECAPLFGIGVANHVARHDPARVLAECEAKRALVAMCRPAPIDDKLRALKTTKPTAWNLVGPMVEQADEERSLTLRLLALPYSNHPDYDENWRP